MDNTGTLTGLKLENYIGCLYEILVPVQNISIIHHRAWVLKVCTIAGGGFINNRWLKDCETWINLNQQVTSVKIFATHEQMKAIANFTLKHYQQKFVMYYIISNNIQIISRETDD